MLQNYNINRVLAAFLDSPTAMFGWRSLSDRIKLGPKSTKTYLDQLLKEGVVLEKSVVGRKVYVANRESRKFRLLQTFYTLLKLEDCGFIDHINKEYGYPAITLIGSYARGEAVEGSDIDVVIMTESDKKTPVKKFEDMLNKPVQIFTFSKVKLAKLKRLNPSLYDSIVNGIVISGHLEIE